MLSDLVNATIMGFIYGIGPCTVSCAPLIVPLIMSTAKDKKDGVVLSLIFSLGRVISYMALGFLSGLLGFAFDIMVPKWLLGTFIILLGVAVVIDLPKRCLVKNFKIDGPIMSFFSGIVLGLSPCPPLLALLALAVTTQSGALGLIMGFLFGLGTVISPIIVLGFFSGWFAKQKEFKQIMPYVSGVFLFIVGLFYLLNGV